MTFESDSIAGIEIVFVDGIKPQNIKFFNVTEVEWKAVGNTDTTLLYVKHGAIYDHVDIFNGSYIFRVSTI